MFMTENYFSGPTPPSSRRVLPLLEDTKGILKQASDVLSRKSGRKKAINPPAPPMRISSYKPQDSMELETELKTKMKKQKAKIESATLTEQSQSTFLNNGASDNNDFHLVQKVKMHAMNSSKMDLMTISQILPDKNTFDDGEYSHSPVEGHLMPGQIDKSKYIISDNTARSNPMWNIQAHLPPPPPDTIPERSIEKFKVDKETSTSEESIDNLHPVPHGTGQYPKVPIPLPQRSISMKMNKTMKTFSADQPKSLEFENINTGNNEGNAGKCGKLDIGNVTKVINRFGTIPKGVRIGAYLASMQTESDKSKEASAEDIDSGTDTASLLSCPPMQLPDSTIHSNSMSNSQEKTEEDSDPGIKQEHNVRPSTIARSQSSHMIAEVQSPPLRGLLQRHKSDLTQGKANSSAARSELTPCKSDNDLTLSPDEPPPPPPSQEVANLKQDMEETSKPRPSPRISRAFPESMPLGAPLAHDQLSTIKHFPPRHPSSSSEEPSMETKSLSSSDNTPERMPKLINSLSFRSHNHPSHHGLETSPTNTESTLVSSPDSVIDLRHKAAGEGKIALKPPFPVKLKPAIDSPRVSSVVAADKMTTKPELKPIPSNELQSGTCGDGDKFPSFLSNFKFKGSVRGSFTNDSINIDPGKVPEKVDGLKNDSSMTTAPDVKHEPPGYKSLYPVLKPVSQPAKPSIDTSTNKNVDRQSDKSQNLHDTVHVISKESILQASDNLKSGIDKLGLAGGKSSTHFLLLSEQVLAFYSLCGEYIDSLPPHAKFHARELLSRLQSHSQNLKTFSGNNPTGGSKLLTDLQSTNKEIVQVIQR